MSLINELCRIKPGFLSLSHQVYPFFPLLALTGVRGAGLGALSDGIPVIIPIFILLLVEAPFGESRGGRRVLHVPVAAEELLKIVGFIDARRPSLSERCHSGLDTDTTKHTTHTHAVNSGYTAR